MTSRPHSLPDHASRSTAPVSDPGTAVSAAEEDALAVARQRFVSLWGRMAGTWGISRTMAEVHAWLFITGGPRHAEEVMEALGISRGNASMTLRRLEEWELVTRVHRRGDRKEYFEAEQDVWRMFRTILAQRKKRELDPLLAELDACRSDASGALEADAAAEHDARIDDMTDLLSTVDAIAGQVLGEPSADLAEGLMAGASAAERDRVAGASPEEAGR